MASKEDIRRVSIYINGDPADLTLKQLTATTRKLNSELANLVPGTEAFNNKLQQLNSSRSILNDVKNDINGVGGALGNIKESFTSVFETLGLTLGTAELISFGKELFDVQVKARGIENAFSKLGNTEGLIEKLREASRGLISDMDLEKIAIKANNANIPLEKMGGFLAFAQQRARDTGEDVTELTEKLITGLGKGTTKALGGLGISIVEVKEEFKRTGDMVEAVSNIINRQMLADGTDVENFGDKVLSLSTKWTNFKERLGDFFTTLFTPQLADPEEIQAATNLALQKFGDFRKKSKEELAASIEEQKAMVKYYKEDYDKSQAALKKQMSSFWGNQKSGFTQEGEKIRLAAKEQAEAYQGARNALAALNKEQEKYLVKGQVDEDKDKSREAAAEKAKRELQQYQNQLLEARNQVDQLIAGAVKGTNAGLDAQLKVIQDKYEKLIAKLRELNANKNATAADKAKNKKDIGLLQTGEKNAVDTARDDFNYDQGAKTINDDAKRQADKAKQDGARGLIDKEQLAKKEYEIEQERLKDLYDLQVSYGVDTINTEKENADNEIKEKQRVHDQTLKLLKQQLEAERDFQKAKEGIETAKAALATSVFGVINEIFGKNKALLLAELALEKIIAIGKIEASEGVEIAGYWAKYALVPGGEIIAAGLSAAAATRAGLSIAEIVASGIGQAIGDLSGGGSSKTKKYADGGYSAVDYSNPSGWVKRPTLFSNSSSGKPFIAGEGYKSEYIVSSQQLKDPVVANFVGMMEANRNVRRFESGGFSSNGGQNVSSIANGSGSGSDGGNRIDRIEQVLHSFIIEQSKINEIPVIFNNRAYDTQKAKNLQITNNAKA